MNTTLNIIDDIIGFLLNEQAGSFDQMLNSPTDGKVLRMRGGKSFSSIKKTQ